MVQSLLSSVLQGCSPTVQEGTIGDVSWVYWGEGAVCITPNDGYDKTVILSAGIHGNETAPIELLEQLIQAIHAGQLVLRVRLLAILGNPLAIVGNCRYVNDDLNRLFVGIHQNYHHSEAIRAKQLENWVACFVKQAHELNKPCYHYDLHTAIKPSLLPIFALMPKSNNIDVMLINSLHGAGMQAIVRHSTTSTTFSQFSANCGAISVTLELGKVAAFGQNNLDDFAQSYAMLERLLAGDNFDTVSPSAKQFVVSDIIIKHSEAFRLVVDSDLPNFSQLGANQPLACDVIDQNGTTTTAITYQYATPCYTLFLNPNVKVGLRAGIVLQML